MKIAVVGTGAMGSIYAGLLADAGNEVVAVDVWQEHLDAIEASGLRVEGASGDRTVKGIRAVPKVADAGPCDLYIIATKASGVGSAAQSVAAAMKPDSLVLTIQNGLGAGERIAEHMATENVLLGVAQGFGASMKGPGHAHHNGMNLIRIGELKGGMTDRLQSLEQVWNEAGFSVKAFENIEQLIWEKFVCNVTFSAPCAVFGGTIGEVMADEGAWDIAKRAGLEAYATGRAKKVDFSFEDAEAYITAFGSRMPGARPSLYLDHLAKRPSEIDAINGMVPVLGRQLGVPTPVNDMLTAIVKFREARFEADPDA